MTGPFYRKNEKGEMELLPFCADCAFIDRQDNNCIMISCPCMPPDENEKEEE